MPWRDRAQIGRCVEMCVVARRLCVAFQPPIR